MQRDRKIGKASSWLLLMLPLRSSYTFIHNCLHVSHLNEWIRAHTLHIPKLDVENWLHYVILMTTKSMTSFFFVIRSKCSFSHGKKACMFSKKCRVQFVYGKKGLMCLFSGVHSKRMFRVGCIPFRLLALHVQFTQTTAVCTRQG